MGRSPGLRDLHYPQSTACLTQAGKVNMGMAKAIYEGLKAIVWLFTAGRLRKSLVVIVMIYADEGMFRSHPRQPYDYFFYECIEDVGVPEDGGPQACARYYDGDSFLAVRLASPRKRKVQRYARYTLLQCLVDGDGGSLGRNYHAMLEETV